jgi:hypothetical protein
MAMCSDGGGLESTLFNSDYTWRIYLYEIKINQLIALFEEVGANDPATMYAFSI